MDREKIKLIVQNLESLVECLKKELDSEIAKLNNKNGSKTRESNNELIKNGIEKLAQFLWMQKATWKNNIK